MGIATRILRRPSRKTHKGSANHDLPAQGTHNDYLNIPNEMGPNRNYPKYLAEGGSPTRNPHDGRPQYGLFQHARMKLFSEGGAAEGGHWIQGAIKHPGALHRTMHVKNGHKIPISKLEEGTRSRNPLTRKRANFALTLRKFHRED